jgi:hypothetical protein
VGDGRSSSGFSLLRLDVLREIHGAETLLGARETRGDNIAGRTDVAAGLGGAEALDHAEKEAGDIRRRERGERRAQRLSFGKLVLECDWRAGGRALGSRCVVERLPANEAATA